MSDNHGDHDKTQTHVPLMRDTAVGHYRIVKKIGAGGMGEVYLAEDTELDRKVALKFLPPRFCQDEDCRARFKREAQAAGKLDHSNIVTVHEVGEYQGRPYFAMAYVEGQSLKEYVAGKKLSIGQILELAIQICEGLQAAHDKGITHRDIKPSNILIDSHNRARIVDFGLASIFGSDQLTKTGSTLGTIGYMSPEQAEGKSVDGRSDVFSVGVLLYELLAGKHPFLKDSDAATLLAVINEQQKMVADLNPLVPEPVQSTINRALEKNPDDRFPRAIDFASALASLSDDLSSRNLASQFAIARPKSKRLKILIMGIFSVAAILLATVILIILNQKKLVRPAATSYIQLTFSGKAAHPSISPSGDYIAYATQGEGVWIQQLPVGRPVRLFDARRVMGLSWSPDGRMVAVSAITDSMGGGLYIIHPLERTFRKVSTYIPSGRISWSPENQTVVSVGKRKIFFYNIPAADTSSLPIEGDYDWLYSAEWSPTGSWIMFFSAGGGGRRLWLIRPNDLTQKWFIIGGMVTASWSPFGDAVYLRIFSHGLEDIVKVSVDTSAGLLHDTRDTLLTALELARDDISISRSGQCLAYVREVRISNLWRLSRSLDGVEGVMLAEPLTEGTSYIGSPSVSPDGNNVAFGMETPAGYQVYIMPADGGEMAQVTHLNTDCFNPVWSIDGERIAFVSGDSSGYHVGSINKDGQRVHIFEETKTSNIAEGLTWFPGEKILYLIPSQDNWQILDPNTGQQSPLFLGDTEGSIYGLRYSPDGRRVAFDYTGSGFDSTGIYFMELGDSLPKLASADANLIDWGDDPLWLYASQRTEDRRVSIIKINIETQETRMIGIVPLRQPGTIVRVPGREEFLCTAGEALSDIWLVENFDPEIL